MELRELPDFYYPKIVQYHETDAMGVVHHSNYLRYFEEARVHWLREKELSQIHYPYTEWSLAVLETGCKHYKSCTFNEEIKIHVQVRIEKVRIRFEYFILNTKEELLARGITLHAVLGKELQIHRIPKELMAKLEKEKWIEI